VALLDSFVLLLVGPFVTGFGIHVGASVVVSVRDRG
jgi:hypothetical protein